jgi:hypothetical protein
VTWVAFVLGLLLLGITSFDIVGTLVVPRGVNSSVSRGVSAVIRGGLILICNRMKKYESRDRLLAWSGPITLLARLIVWVCLLMLGFTLVLFPATSGHVARAFHEAGSSMFTLGYAPPTNSGSTLIDYIAAYSGLLVIALQIDYLPTLYAAFNRRETEVTMLVGRAGMPAWGPELLIRTRFGIPSGDIEPILSELFDRWERWSAEVAESHTTYPTLIWLRSPRGWPHWVIAQLAVLDAAALHLSVSPDADSRLRARLCLRMGFSSLRQIAAAMHLKVDDDPDPDAPLAITYEQFASAVAQMEAVGYPIEVPAEEAWPHFRGWRVNYEAAAYAIAYAVDAPPAMWSGPRRWSHSEVAPFRPANRISRSAKATPAVKP